MSETKGDLTEGKVALLQRLIAMDPAKIALWIRLVNTEPKKIACWGSRTLAMKTIDDHVVRQKRQRDEDLAEGIEGARKVFKAITAGATAVYHDIRDLEKAFHAASIQDKTFREVVELMVPYGMKVYVAIRDGKAVPVPHSVYVAPNTLKVEVANEKVVRFVA